jgi:ClpP class serine protease
LDPLSLFWIILILLSFQPYAARQALVLQRRRALAGLAQLRGATVISLIHRQETLAFLGIPLSRHIDIDDSESVLRAIRATPTGRPIEIILHTPGGLVLAASQIASALADHDGKVTAVVPHYAMSGGTLVALAADEILMDTHAALGPVDPQIGRWPAVDVLKALEHEGEHDDETLIIGEIGKKAIRQVEQFVTELLARRLPAERAAEVAVMLSHGRWTHDYPLLPNTVKQLGLPVRVGVPEPERALLELFPQPQQRISPVDYAPGPGTPPVRFPARRARG